MSFDDAGNLYGTTFLGGGASFNCNPGGSRPTGCGTVFKLVPDGLGNWSENILYRFKGSTDGSEPQDDRLVIDGKGHVFGTASGGWRSQLRQPRLRRRVRTEIAAASEQANRLLCRLRLLNCEFAIDIDDAAAQFLQRLRDVDLLLFQCRDALGQISCAYGRVA
ncbi:MAG: hypothetical protein WDM89_13460 [Rhizomicrobium sp.]